jgi:hypothetical protein
MVAVFCSMYIYILLSFYFISFKNKNFNLIYLFKLQNLLHNRIDPTVNLLRKQPPSLNRKRKQDDKITTVPPIGAPSWCLNNMALIKFGRDTDNIPSYDRDSDEVQDEEDGDIQERNTDSNNNSEDENNDDDNGSSSHKRKKKNKSNKKGKKGEKQHKSKKRRK